MSIVTVCIDLAKNVFALHGVNATGDMQLRQPKLARSRLNVVIAALPSCTIGMEACTGAHRWARLFAAHGHTVKLMAQKLVAPTA
jgi:transposase